MSTDKDELPFGSEFSPSQVKLPDLLDLVFKYQGDVKSLQAAIMDKFFASHAGRTKDAGKAESNKKKLAMNCRLGMTSYGLIDSKANFTEVGRRLYELRHTPEALYEEFAKHILLKLNGMRLVSGIQAMVSAGEEVNLDTLRRGLGERGLHFPRGGKHPSMMRLWLAEARIFPAKGWNVNSIRLHQILGTEDDDFAVLSKLTAEQRAFLMALANSGYSLPQPANEIAKLAEATYGVRFPEKSLPKLILNALQSAGYITAEKTTEGRGSRPFMVTPTEKLKKEIVAPLLDQLRNQVDPKLAELLDKPLSEILVEVQSEDRYVAGLALEALSFKLMRSVGLSYVATRRRAADTGGAEVDVIFESARLVFSRWQIQCKRQDRVSLDDVAKEVGLTHFLKSNVIVVITTGEIGREARRYSDHIMRQSNLCVVLINGEDLKGIQDAPSFLVDVFRREAQHAMTLKKIDLKKDGE